MNTTDVMVPPLNDQQATGILTEALNRGMMEGQIPPDEATRLSYAQQLVSQAKLAWDSGNRGDNVTSVLFIAEAEMNPEIAAQVAPAAAPVAPPPGVAPVASPPATPPIAAPPVVPAQSPSFDFTTLGDDTIVRMIETLQGPSYADNPQVQTELAQLRAEQQRRGGVSAQVPQAQAVPSQQAPAQPAAAPGAVPAPLTAAPAQPGSAAPVVAPPAIPGGVPGTQPSAFAPGQTAGDAQSAVPIQAPPTIAQEAQPSQAESSSQDGERATLLNQLTIASLRAHGIDPAEASTLSIESLRAVVENPQGSIATTTTATPPDTQQQASSAREQLVEQISGPMLKAYGRGRRDIPQIGDNEIMLMIQNPDGKVDPGALSAARAADAAGQQVENVPAPPPQQAPVAPPVVVPPMQPQVPAQAPPQMAAPSQSAFAPPTETAVQQAIIQSPPGSPVLQVPSPTSPDGVAAVETPQPPLTGAPGAVAFSPLAVQAGVPAFSQPAPVAQPAAPIAPPAGAPPMPMNAAQAKAMEIITAENMPIPPEIEGNPPRLPNDLSKVSDAELFSFHAQFHACEVRMNWVISQQEDAFGDAQKLLRDQRRKVLLALPPTGDDGKKITKELKEAMAEDDAQVQQFRSQVEEIEEVIGKLRVLRDGYHQDVSTCSRQWSMRSFESEKMPR